MYGNFNCWFDANPWPVCIFSDCSVSSCGLNYGKSRQWSLTFNAYDLDVRHVLTKCIAHITPWLDVTINRYPPVCAIFSCLFAKCRPIIIAIDWLIDWLLYGTSARKGTTTTRAAAANQNQLLLLLLLLFAPVLFAQFAARWHGWHRLIFDDVITFLLFASEAFLWRGAWNLNARFLIEDTLVGGWTNHVIGTALLMSFQLFSYVGSCGCSTDGEQGQGGISYCLSSLVLLNIVLVRVSKSQFKDLSRTVKFESYERSQ